MYTEIMRILRGHRPSVRTGSCAAAAVAAVLAMFPFHACAQFTPAEQAQIRNVIGNRIEALSILGGDYGIAAANFRSTGKFAFAGNVDSTLGITKVGGDGEIGDPQPVGSLPLGWQPRLQGNMGWLTAKNHLHSSVLEGDTIGVSGYGIEFGGGARLWVNDRLSFAPTLTGLYGHTSSTYTAVSAFMRENLSKATALGLIDWSADTWTVIPRVNVQYLLRWDRTMVTLSTEPRPGSDGQPQGGHVVELTAALYWEIVLEKGRVQQLYRICPAMLQGIALAAEKGPP
jgi:hypothetical protein